MRGLESLRVPTGRALFLARLVTAFGLFTFGATLHATTLLPLSDGDLRARSAVIVEGVVLRVDPFEDSRGFPETQSTIRPIQVFKGRLAGDLVVRDRGGVLPGGRWMKIFGRPEYVVGRRVLVFAIPHPDGEYQTAEFTLGKFEVWKDSTGRRFLARDLVTRSREGIQFLATSLAPAGDTLREYDSFVRLLRSPRNGSVPLSPKPPKGALVPDEDSSARGIRPLWADWGTATRYRWDNGATVAWILSSTQNLITGGGYTEARAALAEWTNHPNSTIHYTDGGLGTSGANFIDLASVSVCGTTGPFCGGGVIGCGGPGGAGGTHTWRGDSYGTISWAHVEIRQTTGPTCIASNTFAAAVTHELGHTLGFGHSDQGASPNDVCRGDENLAQMRSTVQSRGTSLGTDDSDAARWVYGDGLNSCSAPSGSPTPTATQTPTAIPPTATQSPTAAPPTATRTPTAVPPTATRTPTSAPPTPTPTPTALPPTATPTATSPPPTETAAPPPTATPTATRTPTATAQPPVPTPTPTAIPPTATPATPTPTPPPSSEPVRANFGWTPLSPHPGEAVYFTDLSTGSPASWSWKFGNPATGASNASTLPNPIHVFSGESTFTVTLTVRTAGGRSTRRQKVVVSAAGAVTVRSANLTVPVAGHVRGLGGHTFLTDVQIENPAEASARAMLSFQPRDGEAPRPVGIELAPRETANVSDAILGLFSLSDSLGALRLDWEGGPAADLRMTSRTYTRNGDGTLGQAAAGFASSGDPRASQFVTGIVRSDLFRTNLGAVNDSREFESFQIVLRNRGGEIVGASGVIGLAAGRQTQVSVADLFPASSGKGLTAEIRPLAGSAAPFGYAAVVDNLSGDPTFYPARAPSSSVYLPAVARVTGYGGTYFSSDVSFANAGDDAAIVEVTFLAHDRDNSRAPSVRFMLAAHETLQVDDALGDLFHLSETYGALAVESSDSAWIVVSERISTASAMGAGTVGQQVDAISDDGFLGHGSILGLRQDTAFRSNVGVFNPEPFSANVTLTLRRADGQAIGETVVAVTPLGYVQRSLGALFPGVQMPDGQTLTLSIDSPGIDVFAFAAVIDNVSQDPTFSPGLR